MAFQSDQTRINIGIALAVLSALIFVGMLVVLFVAKQRKPERMSLIIFNLLSSAAYVVLGVILADASHFESFYQPLFCVQLEAFGAIITGATCICLWILGTDYESKQRLSDYVDRSVRLVDQSQPNSEREINRVVQSSSYQLRQYAQIATLGLFLLVFAIVVAIEWSVTATVSSTYLDYLSIGFVCVLVILVGVVFGMVSTQKGGMYLVYEVEWIETRKIPSNTSPGFPYRPQEIKRLGAPFLMFRELKDRELNQTMTTAVTSTDDPVFVRGILYTIPAEPLPPNSKAKINEPPGLLRIKGRREAFFEYKQSARDDPVKMRALNNLETLYVADNHTSSLQRKYRNFRGRYQLFLFFALLQLLIQGILMFIDWAFSTQGWTQFRDFFWVLTQLLFVGFMATDGFDYAINLEPLVLEAVKPESEVSASLPIVRPSVVSPAITTAVSTGASATPFPGSRDLVRRSTLPYNDNGVNRTLQLVAHDPFSMSGIPNTAASHANTSLLQRHGVSRFSILPQTFQPQQQHQQLYSASSAVPKQVSFPMLATAASSSTVPLSYNTSRVPSSNYQRQTAYPSETSNSIALPFSTDFIDFSSTVSFVPSTTRKSKSGKYSDDEADVVLT